MFDGGFPPFTYDWGESGNYIGDRFDFNVYPEEYTPSRQVLIPNQELFFPDLDITVTDRLGCSINVGIKEIFVVDPLAVEDNEIIKTASIYPNPASDFLIVELANSNTIKLLVFNLKGERIEVPWVRNSLNQLSLDIRKLPSGKYLLSINSMDEDIRRIFVKSN